MHCKYCGKKIKGNENYCDGCGEQLRYNDSFNQNPDNPIRNLDSRIISTFHDNLDNARRSVEKQKPTIKNFCSILSNNVRKKFQDQIKTDDDIINSYLLENEKIEDEFALLNLNSSQVNIYATNMRLFIKEGRNIRDANYEHISSIQFRRENYLWLSALGGIILLIISIILPFPGNLLIIPAILLLIIGIFYKTEYLEVIIIGLSEPLRFTGNRTGLDSLFKIIRKNK